MVAYPRLAELLSAARARQGLSQDAVAHQVEVQQQTYSRWEMGRSRPRGKKVANLAAILGISAAEIRDASTAEITDAAGVDSLPHEPVRPLSPVLPFGALSEDSFESFVAGLLQRQFPDAEVHRLGGRGDDQAGYDIEVIQPNERRIGVQCKREVQFGPAKVRKAVEAAELDVDTSVIALSRAATNATRDEVKLNQGWQLWDQLDLSRRTRMLGVDDSLSLVRTYFPSHVEAFLGLPPAGPWMTAEEYFRNDSLTLLNHRQNMIGRSDIVDEVWAWASAHDDQNLGVVVGRGGIGKSKLLWEVATRKHDVNLHFRFLAVDQSVTPRDFDLLPRSGTIVVMIDDQSNLEHVAGIASQLWKERPNSRLLVAIRPESETVLKTQIWQLGRKLDKQARWELSDLPIEDARELVSTLINRPVIDPLTMQLAVISADCPLIAVIAADLLRTGELTGSTFQTDRGLRAEVLQRFGERQTGHGSEVDIAERRSVLVAIAAYQPVRLNDDDFARAICSLTEISSWDRVNTRIRELEDAGRVLRRGDAVRVVPDMLGDVALAEAAYDDRSSRVTGLLSQAQAAATGRPLEHLLVNASRMEWQIRKAPAQCGHMVDEIWRALTSEASSPSYGRQIELLHSIAKAAFFQPRHALDFVNTVLSDTAEKAEDAKDSDQIWRLSRQDVLNAIPPVLHNIAYNTDYLRPAVDLLWRLAQNDPRPLNQHPEHPLRILQSLARLSYSRPHTYIHALIDAAESWLTQPYTVSPFEVLKPVLAVQGSEEIWSDRGLTLYSYPIHPDQVRPLRQRVIDLAVREARGPEVSTAVRAIRALEEAIREPRATFGRDPSADDIAEWADEFIPILDVMGSIGAQSDLDPAVRLAIREAVQWHATYGADNTKSAANAVLNGMYNGPDDDLSRCLHGFWRRLDLRHLQDYAAAEQAVIREDRQVIQELVKRSSQENILELLEVRIRLEQSSFDNDGSSRFLWNLFTLAPDIAIDVCESALAGRHPVLTQFTPLAVGALLNKGNTAAVKLCESMLGTEDIALHRHVATGLSWNRTHQRSLVIGELALLQRLAGSDDSQVQAAVGRAACTLGYSDTEKMLAYEVLSGMRFHGSGEVAAEILQGFTNRGPLRWAEAGEAFVAKTLAQLVECDSIDQYVLMAAISELSATEPLGVTKMLLGRIDRSIGSGRFSFRELPLHWDPPLRICETVELGTCLVEARRWIRDHVASGTPRYAYSEAAKLFSLIVGEWNEQAMASLGDATDATSSADLVAMACILAHAPQHVLFANATFVARLLQRAKAFGQAESDAVFHALLPTSYEPVAVWTESSDQPEIDRREQALEIAATLPTGSVERKLFESLATAAEWRGAFLRETSHGFDNRDW